MIAYTTPTFTLKVPNTVDLTAAQNVCFTMKQDPVAITKEHLEPEEHQVSVYLTQAESGTFKEGKAKIQLNWTYEGGGRGATKWKQINIEENLLKKVIE